MCGEDGTQRVVYKLKEEHAGKGHQKDNKKEKKEKRKEKTEDEKREKQKNYIYYKKKKPIVVPALSLQYT